VSLHQKFLEFKLTDYK